MYIFLIHCQNLSNFFVVPPQQTLYFLRPSCPPSCGGVLFLSMKEMNGTRMRVFYFFMTPAEGNEVISSLLVCTVQTLPPSPPRTHTVSWSTNVSCWNRALYCPSIFSAA